MPAWVQGRVRLEGKIVGVIFWRRSRGRAGLHPRRMRGIRLVDRTEGRPRMQCVCEHGDGGEAGTLGQGQGFGLEEGERKLDRGAWCAC